MATLTKTEKQRSDISITTICLAKSFA